MQKGLRRRNLALEAAKAVKTRLNRDSNIRLFQQHSLLSFFVPGIGRLKSQRLIIVFLKFHLCLLFGGIGVHFSSNLPVWMTFIVVLLMPMLLEGLRVQNTVENIQHIQLHPVKECRSRNCCGTL